MLEEAPKAPAGWYPSPSGGNRYWDGESWLNIPEPSAAEIETAIDVKDSEPASLRKTSRFWSKKKLVVASSILLALFIAGGTIAWKVSSDAQAAETARVELLEADAAKETAAVAAQKKADDAERAARKEAILGIEASVQAMAEEHVTKDIIDGPIISTSCSPVGGGSSDDLTETTTVFKCFVANLDNGDGTLSGYNYNATMNWTTGSYTYGMGAP